MSQPICILCAYYHPRSAAHAPDRRQSCPAGRARLESDLFALHSSYQRLQENHDNGWVDGHGTATLLAAAPVPSPSKQPRVSGSRERSLVIDVDAVDLQAPARAGSVRDPNGDQVGQLSVATVLYSWVGFWRERFYPSEKPPRATVEDLLRWIHATRLDHLADVDETIADFAEEVHGLRAAIRNALKETRPRREVMLGIACPNCKRVSVLNVDPDDPQQYRECAVCGLLLTQQEYYDHLKGLVAKQRTPKPVEGEPVL